MFPAQFKGPKPLSVIRAQCEEQGLIFTEVAANPLLPGYACVAASDEEGAYAFYNETNGHFFGRKDDQESFTFNAGEIITAQPDWYYALLRFFLEPADQVSEVVS